MTDAPPDWSRDFDDLIALPNGNVLRTLHDAGHYVTALPKGVQDRAEWQTAAEMLILAAQGQRPFMFVDIAMRRVLHTTHLPKLGHRQATSKPRRTPAKKYNIVCQSPLAPCSTTRRTCAACRFCRLGVASAHDC